MIGQTFIAAFALGGISSMHCVGMCGPLVLSLPLHGLDAAGRWKAIALYHGGRIGIYSFGGLLFGLLGHRIYLAGWQQGLSILLGVAILAQLLFRRYGRQGWMPARMGSCYAHLQRWMGRLWVSPSTGRFLLMGLANGLLPCGMVYLAIAAALTTGSAGMAMGFLFFFGLGTLPLLLGLQTTGRLIGAPARQKMRRLLPFITAFIALLLILRGLGLGIPFVSPVMAAQPSQVIDCH